MKQIEQNTSTRTRLIARVVLLCMLLQLGLPTFSWALTSGPSQPEVQSFTPIGTSDMVDPFSGDFNYNIPLIDVDGYPVNIAYHAGITPDQEASWVGLGWNINVGATTRALQGLPDDFNGDEVEHKLSMLPNETWGLGISASYEFELFGNSNFLDTALAFKPSINLYRNNYTGWGFSFSAGLGVSASKYGFTAKLGVSGSNTDRASIQPSLALGRSRNGKDNSKNTTSISFGGAFNTRAGLKSLGITTSTVSEFKKKNAKGKEYKSTYSADHAAYTWTFGMPTYTPVRKQDIQSYSFHFSIAGGSEATGFFQNYGLNGSYSRGTIKQKTLNTPSYGYFYSENAGKADQRDFNVNDGGSFNPASDVLPMTNYTYDVFSISGQGASGNFRPMRNQLEMLSEPETFITSSVSGDVAVEVGGGFAFHGGLDVSVSSDEGYSGRWSSSNGLTRSNFSNSGQAPDKKFESFNFREASELAVLEDDQRFNELGGFRNAAFGLDHNGRFSTSGNDRIVSDLSSNSLTNSRRTSRMKRASQFTFLTMGESKDFAVQTDVFNDAGLNDKPNHHMGEVTYTSADGARYVYGLPAYVHNQLDVTFSVGSDMQGNGGLTGNESTGIVTYDDNDDTDLNGKGYDHYMSSTKMPAYAHSHMLTSILSSDYVDSDNIAGPSDNDLGAYTTFGYTRVADFKFRHPYGEKSANYNSGLKSISYDDKASYQYGEKDLYFLNKIETKNYIALFVLEDRLDGLGVLNKDGAKNTGVKQKCLKEIRLYAKSQFDGAGNLLSGESPIKTVHFEYDYSLCQNSPNSDATTHGKLTLRKIYFTYSNSNKAKFSSYNFYYAGETTSGGAMNSELNPDYNAMAYDRWGTYKPNNGASTWSYNSTSLSNSENPYTPQDKNLADKYAAVWALSAIRLPSGGFIQIEYEADDYAYVQDKDAMRMMEIVGTSSTIGSPNIDIDIQNSSPGAVIISDQSSADVEFQFNRYIIFNLQKKKINGQETSEYDEDIQHYFNDDKFVFVKALIQFRLKNTNEEFYEYVPGYYEIAEENGQRVIGVVEHNGVPYGYVRFQSVKLKDNGGDDKYSPITKAGLQFARMNLTKQVMQSTTEGGNASQILLAMKDAAGSLLEFFKNPNTHLYNDHQAQKLVTIRSQIRVREVNSCKLGGGHRVKRILINDNWEELSDISGSSMTYGQEYNYTTSLSKTNSTRISSGVAQYEPQVGAEENPFHQPVFYDVKFKGVPDEQFFHDDPIGEMLYPMASVGYSEVRVNNLSRENVSHNATGFVVQKFYTAKDFPIIADRTLLDSYRDRTPNFSLQILSNFKTHEDYYTGSQGFYVEMNDMHGKPMSQEVYAEGATTPKSFVKYEYKLNELPSASNRSKLNNLVTVVNGNGSIQNNRELGVVFDAYGYESEQNSVSNVCSVSPNLDMITLPFGPFPIPSLWFSGSFEKNQFRSMTLTKVVQRFGLLERTIASDVGSYVETENLAYDAESGQPILTRVTTNFKDEVYNLTIPAYWKYDQMNSAAKNIGMQENLSFDGVGKAVTYSAKNYYTEGDELALTGGSLSNPVRVWIIQVADNFVQAVDKFGHAVLCQNVKAKVVRSGYRNMQGAAMQSITTRVNPINLLATNIYSKVIQASAIEYSNDWQTQCNCFNDENGNLTTTNPFILGIRGSWKPSKSYSYLTERTQSDFNNSTNVREDGYFKSFTPFYKISSNGIWEIDTRNWTFSSAISRFGPQGQELENKDALNRYSSARFVNHQSLPSAVAANTAYNEFMYDNFEFNGTNCDDKQYTASGSGFSRSSEKSHTGIYALKVQNTTGMIMQGSHQTICDVNECNLNVNFVSSAGGHNVVVTGGTPIYTYNIGSVNTTGNSPTYSNCGQLVIPSAVQSATITVTDATGCAVTATYVSN
jgi:hypothetical protein